MTWTPDDVPDLDGKTFVVTGGNSGIGLEAARIFVRRGARVVLACRSAERAMPAVTLLSSVRPGTQVSFLALNLADLSSVRSFSERIHAEVDYIDVLVNNAGVMRLPRTETVDGFEMQLATNHLGHFALTGLLLDLLQAAPAPRVVTVASLAHRRGVLNFDDLMGAKHYDKFGAYCQSKLANLLFHYELGRRASLLNVACHPGYTATKLVTANARLSGSVVGQGFWALVNRFVAQEAGSGSHTTVYAATMPDVRRGDYYGPAGMMEMWGAPTRVQSTEAARDEDAARRLWDVTTELTGVPYSFS